MKYILIALVLLSCDPDKDYKAPHSQKTLLHTIYYNMYGVSYSVDSSTHLCFAQYGAHGFTCVPCDSLKNLQKK